MTTELGAGVDVRLDPPPVPGVVAAPPAAPRVLAAPIAGRDGADAQFPPGLALDATVQAAVDQLLSVATESTLAAVVAALGGTLTVHVDNPPSNPPSVAALAKDATVAAVLAALGAPAQDDSVDAVKAALGAPAQDGTLQALLSAMSDLTSTLIAVNRDALNQVRALPYSKSPIDDSMRVTLTGGSSSASLFWANANVAPPAYYSTGAPTSMDARDQQAIASRANFQIQRNRWAGL